MAEVRVWRNESAAGVRVWRNESAAEVRVMRKRQYGGSERLEEVSMAKVRI
jgi:hypothetical protein